MTTGPVFVEETNINECSLYKLSKSKQRLQPMPPLPMPRVNA